MCTSSRGTRRLHIHVASYCTGATSSSSNNNENAPPSPMLSSGTGTLHTMYSFIQPAPSLHTSTTPYLHHQQAAGAPSSAPLPQPQQHRHRLVDVQWWAAMLHRLLAVDVQWWAAMQQEEPTMRESTCPSPLMRHILSRSNHWTHDVPPQAFP